MFPGCLCPARSRRSRPVSTGGAGRPSLSLFLPHSLVIHRAFTMGRGSGKSQNSVHSLYHRTQYPFDMLSFEKWLSKWLRVVSPVSRISCYMYVPFGSMLNLVVWSEWTENLYLCFMLTVYNYDKSKWKVWSVSPQDRNLSFKADINCFSVPIKFYCLYKTARQFWRFYHHFGPSVIW